MTSVELSVLNSPQCLNDLCARDKFTQIPVDAAASIRFHPVGECTLLHPSFTPLWPRLVSAMPLYAIICHYIIKCDEPLSSFAVNLNLRRYNPDGYAEIIRTTFYIGDRARFFYIAVANCDRNCADENCDGAMDISYEVTFTNGWAPREHP